MRISDWSSDVCSSDLQPGRVSVTLSATPGHLYKLGAIAVKAGPTVPPDLIHTNLPLKAGDPIEADRIQGAEANVSLKLPQMGYQFVKLGPRDILQIGRASCRERVGQYV